MQWTDIEITVPQAYAGTAEAIATMVANGGIYIEDYSDLEQQVHQGQSQLELLRRDQKNNTDNIQRIQDELEQQAGRAGSLAQQVEALKDHGHGLALF